MCACAMHAARWLDNFTNDDLVVIIRVFEWMRIINDSNLFEYMSATLEKY